MIFQVASPPSPPKSVLEARHLADAARAAPLVRTAAELLGLAEPCVAEVLLTGPGLQSVRYGWEDSCAVRPYFPSFSLVFFSLQPRNYFH